MAANRRRCRYSSCGAGRRLETRPAKEHHSLAEMTGRLAAAGRAYIGDEPISWVAGLAERNDLPLLHAGDLADGILSDAAGVAVERVAERRATFSRANVLAEVHRQLHGVRFASPDERIAVAERTADLALDQSLLISAPELHHTPERLRRADGTSRFRAKGHEVYTTTTLLEAEARLLDAGRQFGAPAVTCGTVAAVTEANLPRRDHALSARPGPGNRADRHVGPPARRLDRAGRDGQVHHHGRAASGVGGRTRRGFGTWPSTLCRRGRGAGGRTRHRHREHRQVALRAPPGSRTVGQDQRTAQCARIPSHVPGARSPLRQRINAAEDELVRWRLRADQLVIVDEASLAGTFALDELVGAGARAGAKVVLVGDQGQLSAVEAGGMFAALVRDRDGLAPELTDVRRFHHLWEKRTSIELRMGSPDAIDAYLANERIADGDRDQMLDALYLAWKDDTESGQTSLMIAGDLRTVNELNDRARADRVASGAVSRTWLTVAGGGTAGVGDLVISRQNDRRLSDRTAVGPQR